MTSSSYVVVLCDVDSSFGPCFAGGIGCWNYNGYSYINFPDCYVDTTGRGNATFTGNGIFKIDRLEVWNILFVKNQ